MALLEAT
jgi:chromosome segregation ATPase